MKTYNIGQSISFELAEIKYTGTVIDVYEVSPTENVYKVEAECGIVDVDANGNVLL